MNGHYHYCLSLLPDSAYRDDTDPDPDSYAAIADEVTRLMDPDARLADLTSEARRQAADFPTPPSPCMGCGDTFTAVWYRPGTGQRVWSCGTPSCVCYGGMAL